VDTFTSCDNFDQQCLHAAWTYHEKNTDRSWFYDDDGTVLTQFAAGNWSFFPQDIVPIFIFGGLYFLCVLWKKCLIALEDAT
jgi:hypothetical protein